jgi:hypothetical protein
MSRTIALLTDFGLDDVYVGVMKAVMRSIAPDAEFIDITHAIAPQSVRGGALALQHSYRYFPDDTVFLVVVDPGVGSKRRAILVEAGSYRFIAPDNGVLSYALNDFEDWQAVELTATDYRLSDVSATFHGRDVFAPAAAYAARGDVRLSDFGAAIDDLFQLPEPQMTVEDERITGEVTHIDHFGNIITSIGSLRWSGDGRLALKHPGGIVRLNAAEATVKIQSQELHGISQAYHEVPRGHLLAQIDSNGYLEVAINQDDAAQRLDTLVGDVVELILRDG